MEKKDNNIEWFLVIRDKEKKQDFELEIDDVIVNLINDCDETGGSFRGWLKKNGKQWRDYPNVK